MQPELTSSKNKEKGFNQELNLTEYQKKLIKWQRNIDQRYAWVVLAGLWLSLFGAFGPLRAFSMIFVREISSGAYTREEASWPISTILSVNNIFGPAVILVTRFISVRWNLCLAGCLLVLGNVMTALSDSLWKDILWLGIVQGIGMALLLMPLMEIINSYFIRYRTMAFGIAHSGSTLSSLFISPLMQWILGNYHWRNAYLGTGLFGCFVIVLSPLLKPNTKPELPVEMIGQAESENETKKQEVAEQQSSESASLWSILKRPAFHVVWIHVVVYYFCFGLFGIILVDYGADRGCTIAEADTLLDFQMLGELLGRLAFPALVDMKLISAKSALIIDLFAQATALTLITQVSGYFWMATITMALNSFISFSYILLNNLIISRIGEREVTKTYSMASFICGIFISLRPVVIGLIRDGALGTYDPLMLCLSVSTGCVGILWIIEPVLTRTFMSSPGKALPPKTTCELDAANLTPGTRQVSPDIKQDSNA